MQIIQRSIRYKKGGNICKQTKSESEKVVSKNRVDEKVKNVKHV